MSEITRILVVEDAPKHLQDAKAFFASQPIDVDYASTLFDAENLIKSGQYGGLISDIFFPTGGDEHYREEKITALIKRIKPRIEKSREEAKKWGSVGDEWSVKREVAFRHLERWMGDVIPPCGLHLLDACLVLDMPIVLNTDRYHHDAEVEFVLKEAQEVRARGEEFFCSFSLVESGHSDVESVGGDYFNRVYRGPRPGSAKRWEEALESLKRLLAEKK